MSSPARRLSVLENQKAGHDEDDPDFDGNATSPEPTEQNDQENNKDDDKNDGDKKGSYPFIEDLGTYYTQLLIKGDEVPAKIKYQYSFGILVFIAAQGLILSTLCTYTGISMFGGSVKWNESTAA